MQSKLTFVDNLYNFSLVKYEPNDIVLVNKNTKQSYSFQPLQQQADFHPHLSHPYLCRPILFKNGLIYPKGDSNLFIQIDNRVRSTNSPLFSSEELFNSFSPIIQCVQFLHQNNIVHGHLTPQSILFFSDGSIILKDWLHDKKRRYYSNTNPSISDDLRALGLIIAQASCLKTIDKIESLSTQQIICKTAENFKSNFCYALIIMLKGMVEDSKHILTLMNNEETSIKNQHIQTIYLNSLQLKKKKRQRQSVKKQSSSKTIQKQKSHKIKKEPITQSKIANCSDVPSLQGSPTKKFNITTQYKKYGRSEDTQNKKAFNEEVKKRQIQKITKIIERSNAFVNELMARKNNDKKGTSKGNCSMYEPNLGNQNSNMKKSFLKESAKLTSPSKRLRTISKKK